MKHSADFYKVVNAVINTLSQGDCVAYVSGGQGGSGFGLFGPDEDFRELRMHLLDDYSSVSEIDSADPDELDKDWNDYKEFDSSFDFYNLANGKSYLQVMVNPDNYVSSYDLRDMISDDYELECAEITEGMNGYPRGLRGCVLLNGGDTTIDGAQTIADLYGVQLVSLRRKDGWDLWECQGNAYELYDYEEFLNSHDDNIYCFVTFSGYYDALVEFAEEVEDEEERQKLLDFADTIEEKEMGENEFIWVNSNNLTHYETEKEHCDHFSYDTWNYCLALDCMISD